MPLTTLCYPMEQDAELFFPSKRNNINSVSRHIFLLFFHENLFQFGGLTTAILEIHPIKWTAPSQNVIDILIVLIAIH